MPKIIADDAGESFTVPLRGSNAQTPGSVVYLGGGHTHVEEGQECPTCNRRVPRKRKPTTPTSKVHSFRGPLDQADELDEILEAAAKHLGIYEKSWWKHEVILRGAVLILQGPGNDESV